MASVVGGGDASPVLFRSSHLMVPPMRSVQSMKLGSGHLWCSSALRTAPNPTPSLSFYPDALVAGKDEGRPISELWSRSSLIPLCFSPAKLLDSAATSSCCVACPLPGMVVSGGFLVTSWKIKKMVFGWVDWFGWGLGCLVPEGYRFSTGVGSSFGVVSIVWAAGVGSGLRLLVLCFSTGVGSGLLLDYSQCLVACFVVPHGRSLGWCLSSTPRGVFFIVPSGAFKPLILVSTQDNSRWAPYHDGPTLDVYIITVSVVVFLTLTTFHHIV